jgi:hypothetical protein
MAAAGGEPKDKKADQNWWLRGLRSGTGQAVRWLLVLAVVVGHWLATVLGPVTGHGRWLTDGSLVFGQKGNPGSFSGWVPVVIISVVLLLPDVDSIAFGGMKLEMRRTRSEVAGLRQQIGLLSIQSQHTAVNVIVTGLATAGAAADIGERQAGDDAHFAAPGQFTRPA